jgi:hypothetical protein
VRAQHEVREVFRERVERHARAREFARKEEGAEHSADGRERCVGCVRYRVLAAQEVFGLELREYRARVSRALYVRREETPTAST